MIGVSLVALSLLATLFPSGSSFEPLEEPEYSHSEEEYSVGFRNDPFDTGLSEWELITYFSIDPHDNCTIANLREIEYRFFSYQGQSGNVDISNTTFDFYLRIYPRFSNGFDVTGNLVSFDFDIFTDNSISLYCVNWSFDVLYLDNLGYQQHQSFSLPSFNFFSVYDRFTFNVPLSPIPILKVTCIYLDLPFYSLPSSSVSLYSQLQDSSSFNYGYNQGVNDGYDTGYSDGLLDGYNQGYDDGYFDGFDTGLDDGYIEGYTYGQAQGDHAGYIRGLSEQNPYTFGHFFGAIADVPILYIRQLLGFDFFGISALTILMSMITGVLVLFLLRRIVF